MRFLHNSINEDLLEAVARRVRRNSFYYVSVPQAAKLFATTVHEIIRLDRKINRDLLAQAGVGLYFDDDGNVNFYRVIHYAE